MPFTGEYDGRCWSDFSKADESAKPGSYNVCLAKSNIGVSIAVTPRTACYTFAYPSGAVARVHLNLPFAIEYPGGRRFCRWHASRSEVCGKDLIVGEYEREVWTRRHVSFAARFSHPFSAVRELPPAEGKRPSRYLLDFDLPAGEELKVKIALSRTTVETALANLAVEVPDWDFAALSRRSSQAWDELLGRVQAEGETERIKSFYSALYRLMLQPNDLSDVGAAPFYSTFSCWDTFRAAQPLYTILVPERVPAMVDSLLLQGRVTGYLPIWPLWGRDTQCMIGTHSVPMIVDAFLKGLVPKDFDARAAYGQIRDTLMKPHDGRRKENWDLYDRYGYYPYDLIDGESVSRTLECAYDDWCAGLMAERLGETDDARRFFDRAGNWTNVYDAASGVFRGRDSHGKWREPFDPSAYGFGAGTDNDFTEGNAWQYAWHVLHDVDGLMRRMGGKERFAERLDAFFSAPDDTAATRRQRNVNGFIGRYAHGNEHCHHVIYLYALAGRPDRLAERVREVCDKYYRPTPDGLFGNDDCGQMGAWYVFSCMGFYPVDPCGGRYVIGAPQLSRVSITLADGKSFTVVAQNLSEENRYVRGVKLNGSPLEGCILRHEDIVRGGMLEFEMCASPDAEGVRPEVRSSQSSDRVWRAKWIGAPDCVVQDWRAKELPAPVFRKRFTLESEVGAAQLFVCGLGYFHVQLDGHEVTDSELCPTPTKYDSRWRYREIQLGTLSAGEHEVVIEVGNGLYFPSTPDSWHFDKATWFDYPKLIAEITDSAGCPVVQTDRSWQVRHGPTVHTAFRGGESYDARREKGEGWMIPRIVAGPGGTGEKEDFPPCRVVAVHEMTPMSAQGMFDAHVNLSGVPRLTVTGRAGATVTIQCGELLTHDGTDIERRSQDFLVRRTPDFQRDVYVLKGGTNETWRPRFTYHGFRYAKVTVEGEARIDRLEALEINTDFQRHGCIETSDRTLTAIERKAMQAVRSNYVGNPTDCPHREKNGWLSEARLQNESLLYEYDAAAANLAFVATALDGQRPGGQLSAIAPSSGWGYTWGSGAAWESGAFLMAEQAYRFAGGRDFLAERYDCLVKNVDHHAAMCDERGVLSFGLGDWLAPELDRKTQQKVRYAHSSWAYPESTNTPPAFVNTAFYKRLLDLAAEVADRIGRPEESAAFRRRASETARALRTSFGPPQSTTGCALTLLFGLCDESERETVARTLVGVVRKNGHRVDYGTIGSGCVLRALFECGSADDAYRMMVQPDYPGYGYLAADKELTAFPEYWMINGQSKNHGAFADVVACMFRYLGGIRPVAHRPGRDYVEIRPCYPKGLADFAAEYDGFRVAWKRCGDEMHIDITVPDGKTADFYGIDGVRRTLSAGRHRLVESGR